DNFLSAAFAKGLSEKFEKLVRPLVRGQLSAAFAKVSQKPRFYETGANARAVQEVTDFPDSPR
ncbi:MAG: hypothetical protein LBF78_04950, partial [Treponema sp.]|nr:hypothetical protein [Treponema sp.]